MATSFALGLFVLAAVPLHAVLRGSATVLSDDDYVEPACRVPFPVFPEPVCPRIVAGESPLSVLFGLVVVPLLVRRAHRRRLLAVSVASAALAAIQMAGPFAFAFAPADGGRRPSAFEEEPSCGLVNCGLDHTVFHLVQVPFLVALAIDSYRLYRVRSRSDPPDARPTRATPAAIRRRSRGR